MRAAQAGNVVQSGKHIHIPPRTSAASGATAGTRVYLLGVVFTTAVLDLFGCCVGHRYVVSYLVRGIQCEG